MALSRRSGNRFQGAIWPGYVDAVTGLLMVLTFVLTIFMVVQFVLRETISGQESELDQLTSEVSQLSRALGLERDRSARLEANLGQTTQSLEQAQDDLATQSALIASLTQQRAEQDRALEQARADITSFESQVASLLAQRDAARASVTQLTAERDNAQATVADLTAQRDDVQASLADVTAERDALQSDRDDLISARDALQLALAQARAEVDAEAEAARLAAARREALQALIEDMRRRAAEGDAELGALSDRVAALQDQADAAEATQGTLRDRIADLQTELSEEEQARIAEAAAAEALRERLKSADAELTAMTLALEEERRRAEETLTLMAAAEAAQKNQLATLQAQLEAAQSTDASVADLQQRLAAALAAKLTAEELAQAELSKAQERALLLQQANQALEAEREVSANAARRTTLLNRQVAELRTQLSGLQALLDDYKERDAANQVQIQSLGTDLNQALAQKAAEERRRRQLEEAERLRLEAERDQLERYKSEFFGQLRDVFAGQDGVQIVGDRFVFSSEVLFDPGSADLSPEGRSQITGIAATLRSLTDQIPDGIDWMLRVDGHTDDVPLSGQGEFKNNWELSQGRALSVVLYMVNFLGFPADRLSANGFGEYQPIAEGSSPEARAANRRIELKFTER
ncbi:peptidoglycan -binding protein [Pseudooceanicola sp. MF1-13]|uniref:peptidoglycan -binding protein n=1 Tax=Pseudooceanicola sp. MF1-13 TaxID=3379095 RepID=UPI00389219E7